MGHRFDDLAAAVWTARETYDDTQATVEKLPSGDWHEHPATATTEDVLDALDEVQREAKRLATEIRTERGR